jgi:hypothetical protein
MAVKFTKEQLAMDRYRESYDLLCGIRKRTIDDIYAAQGTFTPAKKQPKQRP